jgi:2-keto-3-deoxy-L-rhamnonate aldolase RhmA
MTLPLKDKLARGEVVTMINPDHPSSSLVEFIGTLGFDAIFIDCEHGMAGIERVQDMCRAARVSGAAAIVRPDANEPWLITRYLDAGANGVMVPHIDTAQAARDLVQAVRYARHSDYADKLVVAMVESERALGNLPEILGVDGIDVFFVGPGDLSNTLGMPGQRFHPKVRELVMQAGQRIVKSGKVAGTLVKRENAADYAEGGFRLLYEHANAFLREGAQAFRKSFSPG